MAFSEPQDGGRLGYSLLTMALSSLYYNLLSIESSFASSTR